MWKFLGLQMGILTVTTSSSPAEKSLIGSTLSFQVHIYLIGEKNYLCAVQFVFWGEGFLGLIDLKVFLNWVKKLVCKDPISSHGLFIRRFFIFGENFMVLFWLLFSLFYFLNLYKNRSEISREVWKFYWAEKWQTFAVFGSVLHIFFGWFFNSEAPMGKNAGDNINLLRFSSSFFSCPIFIDFFLNNMVKKSPATGRC